MAYLWSLLLGGFLALGIIQPGHTGENCPGTIAIIADDVVSNNVAADLEKKYAAIGCKPEFVPYPGKRGINMFNNRMVDGELIRIRDIDKAYKRPFVRSSVPVYSVNMALWSHPDQERKKGLPFGYVHGIVWQERYIAKNPDLPVMKYYSRNDMFEAYNMGRLAGVIENDETISDLSPLPQQTALINSLDLYHYLGGEFEDSMKKLSKEIRP